MCVFFFEGAQSKTTGMISGFPISRRIHIEFPFGFKWKYGVGTNGLSWGLHAPVLEGKPRPAAKWSARNEGICKSRDP